MEPIKSYIRENEHHCEIYKTLKDLFEYLTGECDLIEFNNGLNQVTKFLEASKMKNEKKKGWSYEKH